MPCRGSNIVHSRRKKGGREQIKWSMLLDHYVSGEASFLSCRSRRHTYGIPPSRRAWTGERERARSLNTFKSLARLHCEVLLGRNPHNSLVSCNPRRATGCFIVAIFRIEKEEQNLFPFVNKSVKIDHAWSRQSGWNWFVWQSSSKSKS